MSNSSSLKNFDPNGPGQADSGIFGLPFGAEQSGVVLIPIPWEVTVSYGAGTAAGPEAILEASRQVDLYDEENPESWKQGIAMVPEESAIRRKSEALREKAEAYIELLEKGENPAKNKEMHKVLSEIESGSRWLHEKVKEISREWLEKEKMVGIVGGDHSTPLGLIQALSERNREFGILQIDAHADLRKGYEGFTYSHASIMYNAMQLPEVTKLVQVGIRDWCEEEVNYVKESKGRVKTFTQRKLKKRLFKGDRWATLCAEIIRELPQAVYLSFDIDGLDPSLCPNTGTPVPDGLGFEEALYLVGEVVRSGRRIIGFDLCEVSPGTDEWDANVGARVLWRICTLVASGAK